MTPPDQYSLLLRQAGKWKYLRGGDGEIAVPPPAQRDSLPMDGSYNPLNYAQKQDGANSQDVSGNLVGHYGLDTLTTVSEGGALTINGSDQTISNTIFKRRVSVTGTRITFRNCLFLGSLTENTSVINFGSAASDNYMIDCTVTAQAPQWQTQGVKAHVGKLTLDRVHIYGVIDGIAPANNWRDGVRVLRSAIHDLILFSPDPGAVGGMPDNAGHVDAVQHAGGALDIIACGIMGTYDMAQYQGNKHAVNFGTADGQGVFPYHMTGNKYREADNNPSPYQTSVLMMSPRTYPLLTTRVNYSWIDGTSFAINGGGRTSIEPGHVFEVIGNHIGKNHRLVGGTNRFMTISNELKAIVDARDNVDWVSGAPIAKADLF